MGLKYISGFIEDHNGKFFSGINQYIDEDNVKTFSKVELEEIVKNVGFNKCRFFYPYPDYKFPDTILTDDSIEEHPYKFQIPNYDAERIKLFEEESLNSSLAREGISKYLSNSFLLELKNADTKETDDIFFVKLSNIRKEDFRIGTLIKKNNNGKIVTKFPLSKKANNHLLKMSKIKDKYEFNRLEYLSNYMDGNNIDFPFVNKITLEDILLETINKGKYVEFTDIIFDFYNLLKNKSINCDNYHTNEFSRIFGEKRCESSMECMEHSNIDLIFENIFVDNDKYIVIDYEWCFDFPVPVEFIFWKSIYNFYIKNKIVEKFFPEIELLGKMGIGAEKIEIFTAWEENFLDYVYTVSDGPISNKKSMLLDNDSLYALKILLGGLSIHETKGLIGNSTIFQLEEDYSQLNGAHFQLEESYSRLEESYSRLEEHHFQLKESQSRLKKSYKNLKNLNNKLLENQKSLKKTIKTRNEKINDQKLLLKRMELSKSWKITKPFRNVGKLLRRFKNSKKQDNSKYHNDKELKHSNSEIIPSKINKKRDNSKLDIIFFSIIPYNYGYHQRPQHIADYLAEIGHKIHYINPDFSKSNIKIEKINENIQMINLPSQNAFISENCSSESLKNLKDCIDDYITNEEITDFFVFMEFPYWADLSKHLKEKYNSKIIFDILDEFSGFHSEDENISKLLDDSIKVSDLLITTSDYLYKKVLPYNKKTELIRNGTEFEHFNSYYTNKKNRNKKPIIGYYGALSHWFDYDKIEYLAKNRPEYDIVLIGNTGDSKKEMIENIKKLDNVKFLGHKNYKDLPKYLKKFDVALIPFKSDLDLIKATNPVKFYEYLSMGKKIVATEIPELFEYKNRFAYLTNDNEQFMEYIDQCVKNQDILASEDEKIKFARNHSWDSRCEEIDSNINKLYPLASIIILTYNNIQHTKKCVDSILKKTKYPNYEIIIVDNDSKDETPDYLLKLQKNHSNIKIVLNNENYGFAKGNNIGIDESSGEYIILLNNDTIVSYGWLSGLIKHLDKDDNLGLVGPVTNAISNESKINVDYTNIDDMDDFALQYTFKHLNKLCYEMKILAMFCVGMKREVFEDIGKLDENFKVGMFEDDDYSHRLKLKGYKIACTRDVFIHHSDSASFKKLANEEYMRVFNQNKNIFEKKWGEKWISPLLSLNAFEENLEYSNNYLNDINRKISSNNNQIKLLKNINKTLELNNTKPFKFAYLIRIFRKEFLNGNNFRKKNFVKWSYHKLFKRKTNINFDYSPSNNSSERNKNKRKIKKFNKTNKNLKLLKSAIKELNNVLFYSCYDFVDLFTLPIGWNIDLFQRPHQISLELSSKGGLVFFRGMFDQVDNKFKSPLSRINDNLYLFDMDNKDFFEYLVNQITLLKKKKIFHTYSIDMKITTVEIQKYYDAGFRVLYEYIDEIDSDLFKNVSHTIFQKHDFILDNKNYYVISTADKLYREVYNVRKNHNSALSSNGVDYSHWNISKMDFSPPKDLKEILDKGKPIIGYYGALASWVDYELIEKMLIERPDYQVVLIGMIYDNSFKLDKFRKYPNFHFLGSKDYEILNLYGIHFDVCMIPFLINEITESTSPIKLFEYMALKKPIVSTNIDECRKYDSVIIAEDKDEFLSKIDLAISKVNDTLYMDTLKKEALENTWSSKAKIIMDLVLKDD